MDNQLKLDLHVVEQTELQAVSGGYIPMIDVSGMPDRSEMCGTMWYLQQLSKIFRPTRF